MFLNYVETNVSARVAKTEHRRLFAPLLLILATFLLSGCVGLTGATDSDTSSSGLTATPATVSFGSVNTGSTSTRSITLTNAGTADVSVANVSVSGAGFNASGVPAGLILAPKQTANLVLTFAPASTGSVTGKVTVAETVLTDPVAITLSGTGVKPGAHAVTLTWNASTGNVAGYRTYRATAPAGPYSSLNPTPNPQLRWTDSNVQSGATYYYVVTAVAANAAESNYSNQASTVVPKP